jgi:secreted trypsin-like serine protease
MGYEHETHEDELADAASRFARLAAGDDDAAYLQLFTVAYNAGHRVADAPPSAKAAAAAALRRREPATDTKTPDLYEDPTFVANDKLVIRSNARIIGGERARGFPECVAVGDGRGWGCTGTLVAPAVVVTAGHCHRSDRPCSRTVLFGTDIREPRRTVEVREAVPHPEYDARALANDLTVLLLAEEVTDVAPAPIASEEDFAQAKTARLVGFGNTDIAGTMGYGTKLEADVGIAGDHAMFGARPEQEFVAGQPFLNRDSCTGDSGGPAYVDVGGAWHLAGATSRGTGAVPGRQCGDGGIYTRIEAYREWIESVAGPLVSAPAA